MLVCNKKSSGVPTLGYCQACDPQRIRGWAPIPASVTPRPSKQPFGKMAA